MSIGLIVVIIAMTLIAAVMAAAALAEHRRRRLRTLYGAEYERLAGQHGSRRAADRELARRRRIHNRLQRRPVSTSELQYLAESWDHVQGEFLDDPAMALENAGRLVEKALDTLGYPSGTHEDRIALAAAEHGRLLQDYREAEAINTGARSEPNLVSTEAMRLAVTRYHEVFDHLLNGNGRPVTARRDGDREVRA